MLGAQGYGEREPPRHLKSREALRLTPLLGFGTAVDYPRGTATVRWMRRSVRTDKMIFAARSAGCPVCSEDRRRDFTRARPSSIRVRAGLSGRISLKWATMFSAVKSCCTKFWHDFFSGDQVDHGKSRDFHPRFSEHVGERRDAVDHYEGSAHHGGLHRRGAAGDDAGARMKQCGEGFGNHDDSLIPDEATQKFAIQCGRDGKEKFVITAEPRPPIRGS